MWAIVQVRHNESTVMLCCFADFVACGFGNASGDERSNRSYRRLAMFWGKHP
jgi:hypothetical protein